MIREPVPVERPRCWAELMPRPCAEGQAERDEAGKRQCWAFDVEPVPNRGEREYDKARTAWGVAIEAACVLAPRTPLVLTPSVKP